jgi:polyisoprenoid-binding protein YceI
VSRFWKIAIPVVVVLVALGFAGWWFFLRDDAPPEATLVARDAPETTVAGSATSPDGTWTVQQGDDVFAGYRVTEQFAGETITKTAVGRSPAVTGTLTVEGSTIPAATFEVDMTKLASDSSRRDSRIRSDGLQTNQFTTASFTLTQPLELAAAPALNTEVEVQAIGDLTLHGVTKPVTMALQARWNGDTIDVAGGTAIMMADYGINPPSVGGFVSVADEGRLEVQLTLVPA